MGAGADVNHVCFWAWKWLQQVFIFICLVACLCSALIWPWRTCFFPIVSNGDNAVLSQLLCPICWGKLPASLRILLLQEALKSVACLNNSWFLWAASCLARTLGSLPPQTLYSTVGVFSPFTPYQNERWRLPGRWGECGHALREYQTQHESALVSLSTAERQRNGFTRDVHKLAPIMFKSINKTEEKAHRMKLSF